MSSNVEEMRLGNEKMKKIRQEVVISGISGKFPESDNMEELKENLLNNVDMVTTADGRWPKGIYGTPERLGKIKDLSKFDSNYFSVHAKQAQVLDPQIRLMLELTYEAMVDAGVNPEDLRGTNTGVYIGASYSESGEIFMGSGVGLTGYELTGSSKAMFANRISYSFDLKGPSLIIDTACSSSMLAFHMAANAIRNGEIDAAIVGGAHICLKPVTSYQFLILNMLSPDGACKVFDKDANGYVRCETVSVLLLQKSQDAKRIYSYVVHTGINCDGNKKEGITYPSGKCQKNLMKRVFDEVDLNPNMVSYIEAHGTGTKVGDPEEVAGIAEIFCKDRKNPLLVGSVKSNMGHAEPASGVCALAKVIIAMETGILPANLHFKEPNPDLPALIDGRIKVVNKNTKWNGGYVAMNSFGFGGSNAHIILKSNPKQKKADLKNHRLVPVCYSGRNEEAIKSFFQYLNKLPRDDGFISLIHNIHKRHIPGHNFRGYTILGANEKIQEISEESGRREIWYMFTGMGCQWPGMGKAFMCLKPFSDAIHICAAALSTVGVDLLDLIMNANETTFDKLIHSFVCITSIQIGLVDVLTALGIKPDMIIGHSAGELSCGYADGCMTREQAVLSAYWRGKSTLETKLSPGLMAAIGLPWKEAKRRCPPSVYPACHNGENSVTISGGKCEVEEFLEELKKENIFTKKVASSDIAFHSCYISDVAPKLLKKLQTVIPTPKARSTKWLSSSVPESEWESEIASTASPSYYVNNLLSPVLFHDVALKIPDGALVIEIGPHSIFQSILKKTTPKNCLNISLTKKLVPDELAHFMANVGKLFIAGHNPDLSVFHGPADFPVPAGTPMISPRVVWDHSATWKVANFRILTGLNSMEFRAEIDMSYETNAYIKGHTIDGRVLFPAAGYLCLAWKAYVWFLYRKDENLPVSIENVSFLRATVMPNDGAVTFCIGINTVTGNFEITEGNALVVTGQISILENLNDTVGPITKKQTSEFKELEKEEIYRNLHLRGYNYDGLFRGIKSCEILGDNGLLEWKNNWVTFIDTMLQFMIIGVNSRQLCLPTKILKITIDPKKHLELLNGLEEIPIQRMKSTGIIRSGGVEIRGMKASRMSKKIVTQAAKLEQYCFMRYNPDKEVPWQEALTVLVHLVLENSRNRMKIAEFHQDVENVFAPDVLKIIESEPLAHAEILVHSDILTVHRESLEPLNIKSYNLENNLDLVITSDLTENVKAAVNAIRTNGFILTYRGENKDDFNDYSLEKISRINTEKGTMALFRKVENWNMPICLEVKSNFDWIDNLKEALKTSVDTGKKYLLVAKESVSGLVGMFNCLRQEPGGENFRCLFLNDDVDLDHCKEQLKKDMLMNIYKDGKWGSMRHLLVNRLNDTVDMTHAYISTLVRGDLSSLRWITSPLYNYRQGLDLCTVYYSPLNFKDVMIATGKLVINEEFSPKSFEKDWHLGIEFAGIDSNGQRIMSSTIHPGLATHVEYIKELAWLIPAKWSLKEAATIPTVYTTVYYSLFLRGNLKRNESILIHAGSGGVGQAAIRVAFSMDCEVFTTVSSKEKKEFLLKTFPKLKEANIGNSRDTSFEQLVMARTEGRGVDLVLNSLAGELLHASIRCLANYGRFLEIGKFDSIKDTKIGTACLLKSVSFCGIHIDDLMVDKSQVPILKKLHDMVQEGIDAGVVQPLPYTTFHHSQVEQAFRFLATGKHIGKVILEIKNGEESENNSTLGVVPAIPKTYMNPKKSYVVLGGLGGFGLELTNWLLSRGAKNVLLGSRRGVKTGYQQMCLQRWKELGFNVAVSTQDTTNLSGAEKLLEEANQMAPVGGIFNLAVVLQDALFENQSKESFQEVCRSKVNTTKNLDVASRKLCPELQLFVVFSSVSCGRGNPGQTNYGYANSVMERLCEARHAAGLPGLAIQWGAVGDVGLVIESLKGSNETVIGGTVPQRITSCLDTLDTFLQMNHPVLSSLVLADRIQKSKDKDSKIEDIIANILGIRSAKNVPGSLTLGDLGMDSLMGAEIKQVLEFNYDCFLNASQIRNLTFDQLRLLNSSNANEKAENALNTDDENYDSEGLIPKKKVVKMKSGTSSNKTPWFFIHPIEGKVEPLKFIADSMDTDEDIWGLQCTEDVPLNSVEELAELYIKEIQKVQKKGPYKILGYSFGCIIAYEMASQLEKTGDYSLLVFLDGGPYMVSTATEIYRQSRKTEKSDEVDAFAYFVSQHNPSVDFAKALTTMRSLPDLEAKLSYTTSLLKNLTYSEKEISDAAYAFFKKLALAEAYKPTGVINSKVILINSTDNFITLDLETKLSKLCRQTISYHTIEGDHRAIVQGENGKKVARLVSNL